MSDGRGFTDYRPINQINNLLISNNNLTTHYTYREFLINNAETLMGHNRDIAIDNNICDQCDGVYKESSNATEDTNTKCIKGTQQEIYSKV